MNWLTHIRLGVQITNHMSSWWRGWLYFDFNFHWGTQKVSDLSISRNDKILGVISRLNEPHIFLWRGMSAKVHVFVNMDNTKILPYLEYFAKLLGGHLGARRIDDTDIFHNDHGLIATLKNCKLVMLVFVTLRRMTRPQRIPWIARVTRQQIRLVYKSDGKMSHPLILRFIPIIF